MKTPSLILATPNPAPASSHSTRRRLVFLLMALLAIALPPRALAADPLLFISSFAPGDNGAIHAFQFDIKTGAMTSLHKTTGVENPFFLALSPDQKFLYSIHAKKFGGKENEEVAAYELAGRTGQLKLLNRQSSMGTASCYLHVDSTGRTLVVANYTTGSVASLPIKEDGSLGEAASFIQHTGSSVNASRQKEPHAHSIVISPDNRFACAADLGLDKVLIYRLDAGAAKLTPNDPPSAKSPAGAGPRHLTFHPNGRLVYVINELINSVTVFAWDTASGSLTEKQTIPTLPQDFKGTSYCADVKITPDGQFLYGTNRGHDSIAAFRIADDGKLSLIAIEPSLGKGPQNLAITPGGEFLICANMPGKNVVVFAIDKQSGRLKPAGEPVAVPSPSCIMVLR